MKKLIAVLMLLALAFSLVACGKEKEDITPEPEPAKDLLAQIKERGYMTVATEGNWAPWTFHDESDALVGYDVELAKLVAAKLGVEAKFEETDWDSILAGVDSGRFDTAFNGVGYTEDRAQKYYFTDPYAYVATVLVVRGDNEEIKSFEDLKGKTTANTASSTYAQKAESFGATNTPVDNLTETIELLLAGRIDATLNANVSIADYLAEHPDANIKIVATMSDGEVVVVPVRKADDCKSFLEAVNKALAEIKASGDLAKLSEKYFGMDITSNG